MMIAEEGGLENHPVERHFEKIKIHQINTD